MYHNVLFVLIGVGAGLLTGCTNPAASDTHPAGVAQTGTPGSGVRPKERPALQKGMTAAQVRDLWGEPAEIKPFKTQNQEAEIWIYRRPAGHQVEQVQTGIRELPATNPRTGESTTVNEPIYGNETLDITETVELLLFQDRLIEWKRKFSEQRSYD